MTVHNHPPYRPMCPERVVNGHLRGECMDHETIRDQAAIRASWDGDCPDVTRIVRRVGAALNSGRDKAVVDVVLDETQAARDEADTLRTQLAAIRALVDAAGPGFMTFGGGYSGGIVDARSLRDILGES